MLKKYLLYLCLAYIPIIVSCKHKQVKDNFPTVEKSNVETGPDTLQTFDSLNNKVLPRNFSHHDEFISGSFRIVITTNYLNDTLSEHYAWEARSWPIVLSQNIQFMYKDSLSANFDFQTTKIPKQTRKGKSVKSAEIIIWNANLIKGNKADLFGIFEAAGICIGASCPTYEGVFELSGKPVYQRYSYGRENHTLIVGNSITQNGLTYKELVQKLVSIYNVNGISKELMHASYKSQREIGINN